MSRDIRSQLSNLTECSICTETYFDPRILPCVHTFCLKCLKVFSMDKLPGELMTCPICRKEFTLPDNGVDGFPKNFFIEQLKDFTDPLPRHCEECSDDVTDSAPRKQAVMYCIECKERLCEACVEAHKRLKISRGHNFVEIGSNEKMPADVKKMKAISCNKHPARAVEMYCSNCKEVICLMCFVERHKSHECLDVNKVVHEFRQQMTSDIKNMTEMIEKCRDALKEQENMKDDLSDNVKVIEKEICERAELLKMMIDSEKRKLLQDLASRKADKIKQIQLVIADIEQRVSFIEILVKYTKELRDQGAASDVAQQARMLHCRADELLKTDYYREVGDLGTVSMSLEAVKLSTEVIGHIKWQHVKDGTLAMAPALRAQTSHARSMVVVQQLPIPPTQALHVQGQDILTASMLAEAPLQQQKRMLGERLFPLIQSMYPDLAGKITGMLLEIDNSELLHMLRSRESLKAKVEEAVAVLHAYQAKEAAGIGKEKRQHISGSD